MKWMAPIFSPTLLCSLIDHCCLPSLLYATECFLWNSSMFKSMDYTYNQAFSKLFKTNDTKIIKRCQFHMGCLPMELRIVNKKFNFLNKNRNSSNLLMLSASQDDPDLKEILIEYNLNSYAKNSLTLTLWKHFEHNLDD